VAVADLAVPAAPHVELDTLWADRFAQRLGGVRSSLIRELLKLVEAPDIISFAGGLPAPEVFPREEIGAAVRRVIGEHADLALQYGATEGYPPLRELLVRHMGRYGIKVGIENVLVTAGAQQGLDLIGKLLLNPGDTVVTEAPTYMGAIQAFGAYQARFVTVPGDDEGMRVDLLEEALRAAPKFLYVLPNFQNPSGTTLSTQRRQKLVELASHYGTPIIEDDPYGQLRYEGRHLPALVRLDADYHGCANGERAFRGGVVYLGTFSKLLAPGLRVGWIVAPATVIGRLVQLKQGADLHTSTFTQMVVHETARGGFLDRHVPRIREVYGHRRTVMLKALAHHFPSGVRWTRPEGGLFLWVTLPEGLDSAKVLQAALAEKVAFVPGHGFFPNGGGERTLRLNFSYSSPELIETGIARLARVIQGPRA
jgi:2-aminoadipate transaminase